MKELPTRLRTDLHGLYKHLHQFPELSMQEHETAALITRRMRALGFEAFSCGGTGVVAHLRNGDGPVAAFRADTDALPVAERTGLDYASTRVGRAADGVEVPVMHACGHDAHMTCAIGAATLLADSRADWSGTAVFVFQPGEETAEGALAMLEDGLWERAPVPQVVFGQHVWPGRAGEIEVSSGPAMAMSDAWKVTVHGRGGHGSRPEDAIDPVLLAAHMIVRLQGVVAREVPAQASAVVTVATLHAGIKENIIPDSAEFTVNIRNLDAQNREKVLQALRRVISAEAAASGAPEPEIEELYRFPLLINDPESTATFKKVVGDELGAEKVLDLPAQMGSEDFGYLASAIDVPSVYWFFGGMHDDVVDGDVPPPINHSPLFAPALEPTLSTGVMAAYTALSATLEGRR